MVLFPKYPLCEPHRVIYKGYVEEGEGQYPIRKTEDWVENLGGFDSKLYYAAKHGFAYSAAFAYVDIRAISQIKDRKAQIARFAFYTVPFTLGATGWMGGVELGKSFFGRDSLLAWCMGAVLPGGIWGLWRRCPYKGAKGMAFFSAIGTAYQHSTNMNYVNTFLYPNLDNPNIPRSWNPFYKDWSAWNLGLKGTDKEWSHVAETIGPGNLNNPDPGPSWKKWEDK